MGKLNSTCVELSTKKKKKKRQSANEAMSSTPIKDLESIDKIYSGNDTLKHKKPKVGNDRSVIIQDTAQEEQKDNLLNKSLKMPSDFTFESSISEKIENDNQSVTSVLLDSAIVDSSTKKKKNKRRTHAEQNDNLLTKSLETTSKSKIESSISEKMEHTVQSVSSILLDNNIVESSTKKNKKKKHSQAEPNDNLLNGSLKTPPKINSENSISDLLTKSLEPPSTSKIERSISEKKKNTVQSVSSVLLDNTIVESSTKKKKKKKHSQAQQNENTLNGSLITPLKIKSENSISEAKCSKFGRKQIKENLKKNPLLSNILSEIQSKKEKKKKGTSRKNDTSNAKL